MDYYNFIKTKQFLFRSEGILEHDINPLLFNYQKDIVAWSLRLGRSAIFADCGMGKTFMQVEWAKNVASHTKGKVLIFAPLAVSNQTIEEAKKLGVEIGRYGSESSIQIINYDQLHNVEASLYSGVVLDESSILKNFDGKTRNLIIDNFKHTQFKLACTATPSPNDFMELGNHAEFVGAMTREEMLSMFFVHDGGDTSKWRIKSHAKQDFWRWISSWAAMITKPSDLGYSDEGFTLPDLIYHQHIVPVDKPTDGFLFALQASTLQERIMQRRETVEKRCNFASDLINQSEGQFLVWCDRNDESDRLSKQIHNAVEVKGSDNPDKKSEYLLGFGIGNVQRLVSKPKIAGFGMNWQSCNQMAFVGLSDSYEAFYQAVRRCWRFGQNKPVNAHIIIAETEGNVLQNIQRKDFQSKEMQEMMLANMADFQNENIKSTSASKTLYIPTKKLELPNFI